MKWWVLQNLETGEPVVPFDCNPKSKDEGVLAYRSYQAARAACSHQKRMYDVDCVPLPIEDAD